MNNRQKKGFAKVRDAIDKYGQLSSERLAAIVGGYESSYIHLRSCIAGVDWVSIDGVIYFDKGLDFDYYRRIDREEKDKQSRFSCRSTKIV